MNLIPPENRVPAVHYFCRWWCASIFFQTSVVSSERRIICPLESRSSEVVDFGSNRKCLWDFRHWWLIVTLALSGTVSEIRWFNVENYKFSLYPSLISRCRSGWPRSNFWNGFTDPETRVFEVADGDNVVILACVVLIRQRGETDRRTDGQTDSDSLTGLRHPHSSLKALQAVKTFRSRCQSNIYIAPKFEGRIWGAGVWVTRRDRQERKGEI